MRLLVSDANILLDFEVAGLASRLFEIDLELLVPDVLFEEELAHGPVNWSELGLRSQVVAPEGVARAHLLASRYRRASRNDLLALALAEQEGCPLATGDRALRDAASREQVEVRGTLWLAGRMVERGRLTADDLRAAYTRMRQNLRRLPWSEVDAQLVRLGVTALDG